MSNPNHDPANGEFTAGAGLSVAHKQHLKQAHHAVDPGRMSNSQIKTEFARLDAHSSKVNQRLIDEGRGYEKPMEIITKTDPLSVKYREIDERQRALKIEADMRYGPGLHSVRHLGSGKPRVK